MGHISQEQLADFSTFSTPITPKIFAIDGYLQLRIDLNSQWTITITWTVP